MYQSNRDGKGFGTATMSLADMALDLPLVRDVGVPVVRKLLLSSPVASTYWRLAPIIHRRLRYLFPDHVDSPIQPFALVHVDPDRITRFTGREFPVWRNRWREFGEVRSGNWDRRESPPIDPEYAGADPSMYIADRFTETPLHEGLRAHFVDGVDWDDLDFIQGVTQRVRNSESTVWNHCSTVPEIRAYCRELDQLHRDMRVRGCLPMRELNREWGRPMTFSTVMENEILIDVGRDGDPLFVTGRHRLSLAKLLGLDSVPVAVVVRHPRWLDTHRDRCTTTGRSERPLPPDHDSTLGERVELPW